MEDPSQPYWLLSDAFAPAAGAWLTDISGDGVEKRIDFASLRFTPTEMRWSTIEREAFAMVCAQNFYD